MTSFSEGHAAELATEMVLAAMNNDFPQLETNLAYYGAIVPSVSSNTYYQINFSFFNPKTGVTNQADVEFLSLTNNIATSGEIAGMNEFASSYRILAVAQSVIQPSINFSSAEAQLNVEFDQVPVFEFSIFYNGLMEFSDTATLNVNGPVHGNGNIYVGSPDNLTFNSLITTTGTISAPANAGYPANTWTGKVNYNGSPSPGYLTNQPPLSPLSSSNAYPITNVQQILYPPQIGEFGAVSNQLYYNKAGMTIIISNTFFTVRFKSSASDPSPGIISMPFAALQTNKYWTNNPWLTTTATFKDYRENKTVDLTQIDVAKLATWMNTNGYVYGTGSTSNKFTAANSPLNIVYVADFRSSGSILYAVRLVNGTTLPPAGLTVATPNPMYILGNYNCPTVSYQGTTNTTASVPASVACDAITILSPHWTDAADTSALNEMATSDTVNVAIIAGNVPSTGNGATVFSGGVNNLPRLLEDWSSATFTLNTSMVCLFSSTWATHQFVLPGTYYYAPATRNFSFDQNFLTMAKLPPGTPSVSAGMKRTYQRFGATNSFQ